MENYLPGKFEFLILGDIELTDAQFYSLMVPRSFAVEKIEKDMGIYFETGGDQFGYSWEPPGIQMVFNKEAPFQKAKQIAEEVVQNLNEAGFRAELMVVDHSKILRFDS